MWPFRRKPTKNPQTRCQAPPGPPPPQRLVHAFAFEKRGFSIPTPPELRVGNTLIRFLSYRDTERLDEADGVILPSGVFEQINLERDFRGRPLSEIRCDLPQLRAREREISNLLRKGGWCCFLLDCVVDQVPDRIGSIDCSDTDLAKLLMNRLRIGRTTRNLSDARSTHSEFDDYLRKWGIPTTTLNTTHCPNTPTILAKSQAFVVGLEVDGVFLLPIHSVRKHEIEDIVRELTSAIEVYLDRRTARVPGWLDEFAFDGEARALEELKALDRQQRNVEAVLERLGNYKAILARTSDALRQTVIEIFEGFFGLKTSSEDTGIEDLAVLDENGTVQILTEVKGTNGGVKQQHIGQVEAHRSRRGIPTTQLSILVINDFVEEQSVRKRRNKDVNGDHVRSAAAKNILIVRAVDLLFLLRSREDAPDKRATWNEMVTQGGGLLKVSDDGAISVDRG